MKKDKGFNWTLYCKENPNNRNQCDKKCVVYKICKIKKVCGQKVSKKI